MTVPHLVAQATSKSGLVWVTVDGSRPTPLWHLWQDDAAYVLTGGTEQPAPGLADVEHADVTVRSKTTGGRLITWRATVTTVQPGTDEWQRLLPELFNHRLNAPDGREAAERWARECVLLRLDPTGELLDTPEGSGAAPPPPSPAVTSGPLPFVLGRRRERDAHTG
jgi:hypothetical protein